MEYQKYENLTVCEMLKGLQAYGDRNLISYREGETILHIKCAKVFEDVFRMAGYLDSLHLKGSYVVIDTKNTYEQMISILATVAMGAVAFPLNFQQSWTEVEFALDRVRPSLLIFDEDDEEDVLRYVENKNIHLLPCLSRYKGEKSVRSILNGDTALYLGQGSQDLLAPALVVMTSGSTGQSKLVLLPQVALWPRYEKQEGKDILMLPLYHIAALDLFFSDLVKGNEVCLSSIKKFLQDIEWFRPNNIVTVPAAVERILKKERNGTLDISCFRSISTTGAPQNLATEKELNEERNIFSTSLYGTTELGGWVACSVPGEYRYGSVGKPCSWNEVKISESGEVLVRGCTMMLEYIGEPEDTAKALKDDGWYHTGDIGYLDEEGFLFITGRIKNLIILSNGKNVSPEAIEKQLSYCDEIEEVLVYGDNDQITAHIWCGKKDEDKQARVWKFIKDYNRKVPVYQKIGSVVFREEPFKKNSVGKLKR